MAKLLNRTMMPRTSSKLGAPYVKKRLPRKPTVRIPETPAFQQRMRSMAGMT